MNNNNFTITFGSINDSYKKYSLHNCSQKDLLLRDQCIFMRAEAFIILDQIHSAQGYILDQNPGAIVPYSKQGDYSITSRAGVILAVETADCIPLIIVDPVDKCIAAVHAGWRGVAAGIIENVLKDMQVLGCHSKNIQIFFGPCARSCCYQVTEDFYEHFDPARGFLRRGENLFFDLAAVVTYQLNSLGIPMNHISFDNACCTICNLNFCSYRRQRDKNFRQMTIVALK